MDSRPRLPRSVAPAVELEAGSTARQRLRVVRVAAVRVATVFEMERSLPELGSLMQVGDRFQGPVVVAVAQAPSDPLPS